MKYIKRKKGRKNDNEKDSLRQYYKSCQISINILWGKGKRRHVMLCQSLLYNFKNVKNIHGARSVIFSNVTGWRRVRVKDDSRICNESLLISFILPKKPSFQLNQRGSREKCAVNFSLCPKLHRVFKESSKIDLNSNGLNQDEV